MKLWFAKPAVTNSYLPPANSSSTRKKASSTSPRAARLAAMPRRTPAEHKESTSSPPALSAAVRQRLLSSPRATDPFTAALASKQERTHSDCDAKFPQCVSIGGFLFFESLTLGEKWCIIRPKYHSSREKIE